MKRRLLATFLSLCLLVGLLPTVALATDEEPGAEPAPVCTCESLCTEGAADKTCPVCAADYTVGSYTAPAEPVEEPTEEPTVELEDAVRAREAAEAVHDDFLAWYYSMYPETGKQTVRGVPGECALPYSAGPPDQTVDGHF